MGRRNIIKNGTPHQAANAPSKRIGVRVAQALQDITPAGRDVSQDIVLYAVGLFFAYFFSIGFLWNVQTTLEAFSHIQLSDGQVLTMPRFAALLGHWMVGFPLLAVLCLGLIPLYYQLHYSESRSVYLMRRVPKRWALHRRCLTLPLCLAGLTLVLGGLLLVIFYFYYYSVTPAALLQDGQLQTLWKTWFC